MSIDGKKLKLIIIIFVIFHVLPIKSRNEAVQHVKILTEVYALLNSFYFVSANQTSILLCSRFVMKSQYKFHRPQER